MWIGSGAAGTSYAGCRRACRRTASYKRRVPDEHADGVRSASACPVERYNARSRLNGSTVYIYTMGISAAGPESNVAACRLDYRPRSEEYIAADLDRS